MKIILSAITPALIEAWETFFKVIPDVVLTGSDITGLQCDAIVSPANSLGFMDGGLDYELSERFGWDLEKSCSN